MDYISREDATDALMRHRIHISDTWQTDYRGEVAGIDMAVCIIEDLPSADVVEVIRCKDCKYFNLDKWGKVNDIPLIVAHEICDFWGEGCKTDKDGYCSFAERRG